MQLKTQLENTRIAVIGAGAWGTALAANAAFSGRSVRLWGRDRDQIATMQKTGRNERYLTGVDLPKSVMPTDDLAVACTDVDILLLAVPAQTMASVVQRCLVHLDRRAVLVSCAKGIDRANGHTMTQNIGDLAGSHGLAVLSGPSFAEDMVRGMPTAVTVAMPDIDDALALSAALSNKTLRCYASDDVRGVELGGALKNILAIAVGVAHGKGLGASAQAALTARGFAEMMRIARSLGGKPETLNGLSGLGDLILTCGSEKSRNFAFGMALGRGQSLEGLKLAEGALTTKIAAELARYKALDAPLVFAVNELLEGRIGVDETIDALMSRPLRAE